MASLGTSNVSEIILSIIKAHKVKSFIETGTYLGDTAKWASRYFEDVITIELSEELHCQAAQALKGISNVRALKGDSGKLLREVLATIDGSAVFWLDGHHSFGDTAGENNECPLMEELSRIRGSGGFDHVILIDDAHMFLMPPPYPHKAEQWPSFSEVIDGLEAINPHYYVVVFENVIIAVPESLRSIVVDHLRGTVAREPLPKSNCPHEKILQERRLWKPTDDLKLHLGCGETRLHGYVNIDYPVSRHNVMQPQADLCIDLKDLRFSDGVVAEIRLHHVFEHFNRVTALALLIRWHRWLKLGGKLHIETPDVMGCAKTLSGDYSYETKMSVVRHLVGDQSADWGYHVEQWFPERFTRTLLALGFAEVTTRSWDWKEEPYLSNVEVTAVKSENRSVEEQLSIADGLLWESTVSDAERETHGTWRKQLRDCFSLTCTSEFILKPRTANRSAGVPNIPMSECSKVRKSLWDKLWHKKPVITLDALGSLASHLPIDVIQNFNQQNRDHWVATKAQTVEVGAAVLDVGAGTCRYRKNFAHCNYKTHDFKQYEGYQDNKEGQYGQIDYVSDITALPIPDESYDIILCTEVLEHVPEPIAALQEMARILRPGGRLFITAPLGSGLHQAPYHYYGGYTPYWYQHFCPQFGLSVVEVVPNGGFFKLLAQECARVAWTMPQHEHVHGKNKETIGTVFGELLPRFLFALEERCMIDQFTVGYHVEAKKMASRR